MVEQWNHNPRVIGLSNAGTIYRAVVKQLVDLLLVNRTEVAATGRFPALSCGAQAEVSALSCRTGEVSALSAALAKVWHKDRRRREFPALETEGYRHGG